MTEEASSAIPEDEPAVAGDVPPEMPRLPFTDDGVIPGEPDTDVKITTDEGTCLRERIVAVAQQDRQSGLAPTSRPLVITNALLNEDGSVVQDADGRFCISSPHEVVLTNETIGRLGSAEAVTAALLDAREIAAGLAEMEFKGMRLFDQVLSARTLPAPKTIANSTPV